MAVQLDLVLDHHRSIAGCSVGIISRIGLQLVIRIVIDHDKFTAGYLDSNRL